MIRLAVIDKVVDDSSHSIHRVRSSGAVKTVQTSKYSSKTIDERDKNEKMVVIFNVTLNGDEGKDLIRQIKENESSICLYLSSQNEGGTENENREGLLTSIDWILIDDEFRNTLVDEIGRVLNLKKRISPKLANRIIRFITQPQLKDWDVAEKLTDRETEIMNLVSNGKRIKDISIDLGISKHTLKSHLSHIYSKFNVDNRIDALLVYTRIKAKAKACK